MKIKNAPVNDRGNNNCGSTLVYTPLLNIAFADNDANRPEILNSSGKLKSAFHREHSTDIAAKSPLS